MRPGLAIGVAASLLGFSVLILAVGPMALDDRGETTLRAPSSSKPAPASDGSGRIPVPSRASDGLMPGEPERIGPREPLSGSGSETSSPEDRKETVLYRPVAAAAGRFEAMGHSVAIAGVEAPPITETCSYQGRSWACGMRARTAFRSLLRGRAVTCAVPAQPASGTVTATCRLGRDDVGAWLVAQGWARSAAGGPYAGEEEDARQAGRGMYGAPPRLP